MIITLTITGLALFLMLGYNFLSGKALIRDFMLHLRLKNSNLKSLDEKWSKAEKKSDVIVSFTTIPERIDNIEGTIKSLLIQNELPKRINIYLPFKSFRNGKEYIIPEWLKDLKSVDLVRIETDYGPATKFIPAILTQDPDQKILVTDDDNIYPPGYITELREASDALPDKVVAASGWRVPSDLIDRPTTLLSNLLKKPPTPVPGTRVTKPYQIDILQGYSAFLFKPKFFSGDEVTNYDGVPNNIRFVDDVWVSAHCKVDKVVVPMSRFCFTPFFQHDFFKSSSLAKINNWGKEDYSQRNNSIAIKFFEEKW
ncbi:MAG: hypothetical protein ABJG47_03295 [Ekhidna sp.]